MANDVTPNGSSATSLLLGAALTGLLALALPACSDSDPAPVDAAGAAGAGGTGTPGTSELQVVSVKVDKTVTFKSFSAECDKRGGYIQTHATCAGTNACKGLSYNKYSLELMNHTCKAMNSCGGLSCVDSAPDQGRSGKDIYETLKPGPCSDCHGGLEGDPFTYYVPKGKDLKQATADFAKRSRDAQTALVAFGVHGVNENGTAFSNMPAYYERLSKAEIERVIDYVHTLKVEAAEYGTVGVNEEIDPGAGH